MLASLALVWLAAHALGSLRVAWIGARTGLRKLRRSLELKLRAPKEPGARLAFERRLRGRDHVERLAEADAAVVSYGKSGRTWLRVLVSRYYQLVYGLPEEILGFDNFHARDPRIPKIFFTHDNYLRDYTGHDDKRIFRDTRVVLLVRDPRDVAVSQFFQWKYRMKPEKRRVNDFPELSDAVSIYDFVMRPSVLPRSIDWMNAWAAELADFPELLRLRYEDMRVDPAAALQRVVEFLGAPTRDDAVRSAVEYASLENMRKLEASTRSRLAGGKLRVRDVENPDAYKVRRAKVGGYRDYFDDEQIERIDALVREKLSPAFGYGEHASGGRP